jgi:glycosidase
MLFTGKQMPLSTLSAISFEAMRRLRPDGAFHVSPGAQAIGSSITLTLENVVEAPEVIVTDTRRAISWRVGMSPLPDREQDWIATLAMPSQPTILRYYFALPGDRLIREKIQHEGRNAPIYGEWIEREFQIAVYDPAQAPAAWTQGQVIYQIFPDRFARSDAYPIDTSHLRMLPWGDPAEHPPKGRDFFGGNLLGLIDKLDYLAKLGVECIYLTPIFTSPSNHRYDAVNYHEIDPLFGTETQFAQFVEAAHTRNIRVILDAVFNHCSNQSLYFKGAQSSKQSPYYPWFVFAQWPDRYDGWMGVSGMPEFVETPEVENFFLGPEGVANHWLKHKIDGYRTDVTRWVTDEFWRRFRNAVRATNPEAYLIAEEWEDSSHYLIGDTFDATMNYRFSWALHGFFAHDKLTASEFDDRLQVWMRDTPPAWLLSQMNLVDSHDTWRTLTTCGDDKRRMKQITAFQLAYAGAPMIYYGDEAGLTGDYAESGRKPFPWDHIDQDLYTFYEHALTVRKTLPALRFGTVETTLIDDAQHSYVFARQHEDQTVYAAFNAGEKPSTLTLPGLSGRWRDVLGGKTTIESASEGFTFTLEARQSAWWVRG